MIQRWSSALEVLNHINDLINGSQSEGAAPTYPQIQKVWSSLALASLSLRFRGETLILNLAKSPKFFALFLSKNKAPSEWRAKDKTQDWLRSKLAGRRLKAIIGSEKARVLTFVLDRPGGEDFLAVFYHLEEASHFYFDGVNKTLWTSWSGSRTKMNFEIGEVEEIFSERTEVRFYGSSGIEKEFSYEDFNSAVGVSGRIIRRLKKGHERKKEKIKKDLSKNEALLSIEALLVKDEMPLTDRKNLNLNGQTIKLPHGTDHFAKRDFLFGKIKGAKKGIAITRERLKQIENVTHTDQVELLRSPYQWEFIKSAKPKKSDTLAETGGQGYELFKIGGIKAGIGKSAQGNDALRKEFNKKNALWFHLESGSSAHVIVGTANFADLNTEQLGVIASMIRDQQKSDFREISLIYTLLKNVKAVTGTPGKVIYSNIKYIKVNYLANWETLIR